MKVLGSVTTVSMEYISMKYIRVIHFHMILHVKFIKLGQLPRPSASQYFWWLAFVNQLVIRMNLMR